jgi:adenylyl-sulfate kinase
LEGGECLAVATGDFLTEPVLEQLYAFEGRVVVHLFEHAAVDHFVRVRAARTVLPAGALLNLLPIADPGPEMTRAVLKVFGATEVLEPVAGPYPPFVAAILDELNPPRYRQGFCVWFTGLPSSGKSTIAEQLQIILKEHGRTVTMLDGDVVRMHLSKGLGFSREDRDTNIRRIGFVAGEIVKHHGAVIAAAVSPYQSSRDDARHSVGEDRFVLVYVATPAEVCQTRDVKGFYAKARAGGMPGMTGVDDPYEVPTNAEVVLETTAVSARENALEVGERLRRMGFLV